MKTLTYDFWLGQDCEERKINSPTLEEVLNNIRQLDADIKTILSLANSISETVLTIGGGNGKYIVFMADKWGNLFDLVDQAAEDGIEMINAGGQIGDYSKKQIISLDMTIRAASFYFLKDGMDQSLAWKSS